MLENQKVFLQIVNLLKSTIDKERILEIFAINIFNRIMQ